MTRSQEPLTKLGRCLVVACRWLAREEEIWGILLPTVADMEFEIGQAEGARRPWRRRFVAVVGVFHVLRTILFLALRARAHAVRDLPLAVFGPALLACVVGIFVLDAAGSATGIGVHGVSAHFARSQFVFLVLGVAVAVLVAAPRPPNRKRASIATAVASALLFAVLAFGRTYDGLLRWISAGGLTIAPAEVCKPLFVLAAAGIAGTSHPRRTLEMALAMFVVILPAALQPDLVSVVVLVTTAMCILVQARVRARDVGPSAAVGVVLVGLAFARQRALGYAVLGGVPGRSEAYADGVLYFLNGRYGAVAMVGALLSIAVVAIALAARARSTNDPASKLVITGVCAAFIAQVVAQIALGEGLVLLSYGGSSLVGTWALLALASTAPSPRLDGTARAPIEPACG